MRTTIGLGGVVLAGLVTVHCSGLEERTDCLDYDSCQGIVGEGGVGEAGDGGIEGAVIPPTCDITKAVKDSPDCVDDGVGIFVAPAGDDTSPGTKAKPVRSLTKAAELAASSARPRVYICAGTYTDSVDVKQPISFYGGFTCNGAQWTLAAAGVTWNSVKPEFALRIVGVTQRVAVEDVEITAKPGTNPGESSIGVFVAETTELALSRVNVIAGNAANGETKLPKAASKEAGGGGAAMNPNGGAGTKNVCPDGDSQGGNGAMIGDVASAGQPALGGGAAGESIVACGAGGFGGIGTEGSAGDPAVGITSLGDLTRDGWKPAGGVAGKPGTRGQGGGGGGSRQGAGGGGGAGGCGGGGGDGGGGGGASAAVVALSTKVTVVGSKLRAATAGNGGGGAGGQPGQPPGGGGAPGAGTPNAGCQGGDGGSGGKGGSGGGGAGGVSAAIVYKGSPPVTSDSQLTKGTLGTKGLGGSGTTTADGPDGQAVEIFPVP